MIPNYNVSLGVTDYAMFYPENLLTGCYKHFLALSAVKLLVRDEDPV
jgi:hypothetical protein